MTGQLVRQCRQQRRRGAAVVAANAASALSFGVGFSIISAIIRVRVVTFGAVEALQQV
jgi:hypothetical protein